MIKLYRYSLILLLFYFCSCTSLSDKEGDINKQYKVSAFDNTMIIGYNLISLIDETGSKLILLATRFGRGIDKPNFDSYDTIIIGNKYRLNLRLSSVKELDAMDQKFISKNVYRDFDGITILYNNQVLVLVYESDDVLDKFVRIKN